MCLLTDSFIYTHIYIYTHVYLFTYFLTHSCIYIFIYLALFFSPVCFVHLLLRHLFLFTSINYWFSHVKPEVNQNKELQFLHQKGHTASALQNQSFSNV